MSLIGPEVAPKGEDSQPLQGEGPTRLFSFKHPLMGNALRQLRKERRWTHDEAADAMGISRGQFIKLERGERGLTERTIGLAAKAFEVSRSVIIGDDISTPAVLIDEQRPEPSAAIPSDQSAVNTHQFLGPRNVPVYGTGSGGNGGDFRLNGQTIDHAPRPPGIENRRDVYVVYVIGDSVSPKYEDGDPIYVDPHRRPQPRDYVLVELHPANDGTPGDAFVKRLVKRTATKIVVEQHTPAKEIIFDAASVVRLHRVIPYPELIGI
ncbi:helix-turn-helix domain-containing protein [Methylobacterium flocculans]|uniref:helix-turn-helix domain-containing protein n=1 Tax=Methylobacterium flocculans TaxID=2984843 RepID=UPI0021F38A5B|nr:helix-turn-helix domain-containing protein [Methylobacterium sp. FF17]